MTSARPESSVSSIVACVTKRSTTPKAHRGRYRADGGRPSAVLDGENIYPWRVMAKLPKLWINLWAKKPVNASLPFATFTAHDTGEVYQTKSGTSTEAVFGLSADWFGFAPSRIRLATSGKTGVCLRTTPLSCPPPGASPGAGNC